MSTPTIPEPSKTDRKPTPKKPTTKPPTAAAAKAAKPAPKKTATKPARPHRAVRLVGRMQTRIARMVTRAEANKTRADRRANNGVTQTAAAATLQILVSAKQAFDTLMDTTQKTASTT